MMKNSSGSINKEKKRVRRDLDKIAREFLINRAANEVANIQKKVTAQLDINLVKVDREALTLPKRYFVHKNLCRKYRKRVERATTFSLASDIL